MLNSIARLRFAVVEWLFTRGLASAGALVSAARHADDRLSR